MNKKSVLKNLMWRFGERISAQLVTLVVSIILARKIAPEDYGAVAIIMVFITIANVLVNNGFATALIQKKNADNLDFSSVFFFSVAFSTAMYFSLFFAAPFIAQWYKMPILCPTLRVLGVRIVIGAVNSVQQSYVARNMIFKKFFLSTLGGTIGSAIIGIIMAYAGCGIWALIMQYLFNTTIDTVVLWFTVKWRPEKSFSFKRLVGLLSFGWKLLASALIGAVYDDLRTLIIGKVYSSTDLAYYSKGQQFPQIVMTNVNTSVSSVLFPVLSSMQDDYAKMAVASRKLIQMLSGIVAPILLGIAAVATPLVRLLLTEKWLGCIPFLQICCIYYLVSAIYNVYLQSFKAIGKSGLALSMELVDDVIGIILVVLFYKRSVMAIAIVTLVSRGIALIISAAANKKIFHASLRNQFKDITVPVMLSILMFFFVELIGRLALNYIFVLALQIVGGTLFYAFLICLCKTPVYLELMGYFKKHMSQKI